VRPERSGTLARVRDPTAYWDRQAATFDDEPDHGLRDEGVRGAWRRLLLPVLPPVPARVLDVGCGTGSLAVLLAVEGYRVAGLDRSTEMLARARHKAVAAGVDVDLRPGDAAAQVPDDDVDVVLCRHVLWALPDPAAVLGRWVRLLAPAGRLVLVEGRWSTGGGIRPDDLQRLVREHRAEADVVPLTDPALWGRPVDDERYLLVSRR
jgi:SAM-dependent methyltransferase